MIELSDEQLHMLEKGGQGPPTIINPRTKEEYVLVRRDVYDVWRRLLDGDFCTEDAFHVQLESAAAAGWDDPALDVYNDL